MLLWMTVCPPIPGERRAPSFGCFSVSDVFFCQSVRPNPLVDLCLAKQVAWASEDSLNSCGRAVQRSPALLLQCAEHFQLHEDSGAPHRNQRSSCAQAQPLKQLSTPASSVPSLFLGSGWIGRLLYFENSCELGGEGNPHQNTHKMRQNPKTINMFSIRADFGKGMRTATF